MFDWVNPVSNFVMLIFTTVGAVGSLAWWLSVQFNSMREYFAKKLRECSQEIMDKLEYHERHDDRRFAEVRGDVWDIRLRNAAIDGPTLQQRGHLRRMAEELALKNSESKKED